MFLIFIVPFDVRNDHYTYEWVFYRAMSKLRDLGLLMPSNYWENFDSRNLINTWANLISTQELFSYNLTESADIELLPKFPLSYETLDEPRRSLIGPGLIWTHTICNRIPALEAEIYSALDTAGSVEAVFLWTNCASMKAAARRKCVPTIHHELGPLRPPYFRHTAYFDFEGVNGETDVDRRWKRFQLENATVPVLSREELLKLLVLERPNSGYTPSFDIGIALQVPDDSNILAFSRGFNSFEAISTSLRYLPGRTLIRSHPRRGQFFSDLPVEWDDSPHPSQFLEHIEALVTINSSLAFEAMLMGKPTYVLGESPFKYASWDIRTQSPVLSEDEMLRWLNWIAFAYLIPFELTFDPDYSRWRISDPSEEQIYLNNFWRWTRKAP